MKTQEVSLGRFLRIVLLLVLVAISYVVLNNLGSVLLPFAVAWLIAYLLYPAVCFFQYKLRFKLRLLSIVVVILLVVSLVAVSFVLVLPSIIEEFATLKDVVAGFFNNRINNPSISPVVVDFIKEYGDDKGIMQLLQNTGVQDILQMLYKHTQSLVVGTIGFIFHAFSWCISVLYVFFILLDYEKLSEEWKLFLPVRWRSMAAKLSYDLSEGMNQYFRGQALVALCVGILFSIGFIIIDFPLAIAFGLFVGLLNLVPYLQLVSLLPMTVLALLKAANTGDNFWVVLFSAVVVMLVVQAVQDFLLVPSIMGKRMNLHPAIILLSLAVWGHLFGVLGMIVALPLTTLFIGYIKRYHEEIEAERNTGITEQNVVEIGEEEKIKKKE